MFASCVNIVSCIWKKQEYWRDGIEKLGCSCPKMDISVTIDILITFQPYLFFIAYTYMLESGLHEILNLSSI